MNNKNCCGEKLVALGSAISIQIANTLSLEDIEILAPLFTVIGDQLALIAITKIEK